jgi:mannose-1-phosphate guanylyltransferase
VAFSAAIIGRQDPDAVIAVFTADHLIRPEDKFREVVGRGYELAQRDPATLVTFGIEPTFASTGFGYLQLGDRLEGTGREVELFREKPDAETARAYFQAGPSRYLWNSGMFVWRAATLLDCVRRYQPETSAALERIADAWDSPGRDAVLAEVYPALRKISVDYAVMEPASRDSAVRVAAVPMSLDWIDVGSWATFAGACKADEQGNAIAAGKHILEQTSGTVIASSDPEHLIAVLGCEGLVVVHTRDATLVCGKDHAEAVKQLQEKIGRMFGDTFI